MTEFIDLLKYVIPALVVFAAVYFVQRLSLTKENNKERYKVMVANSNLLTPLRLQAYERISILLERLSAESLLLRLQSSGMTARQIQATMLLNVRSEFDHNLSQQIYISSNLWQAVKNAKEILIKTINITASQLPKDAPVNDFTIKLFEAYADLDTDTLAVAMELLKREVRDYFKI
jgi:hypothetical protein